MTDDPADKAGTQDARALLLESEAVLKDLLDGFRSMSERLADGQDVRPAEIKKAITAVNGLAEASDKPRSRIRPENQITGK